jgi:hypothetical protein
MIRGRIVYVGMNNILNVNTGIGIVGKVIAVLT